MTRTLIVVRGDAAPVERLSIDELLLHAAERMVEDLMLDTTIDVEKDFKLAPAVYLFLPRNAYPGLCYRKKVVTVTADGSAGTTFCDKRGQKTASYERLNHFNNRLSLPLPQAEYEQFVDENGGLPSAGIDVLEIGRARKSPSSEPRDYFLFPRVTQIECLQPQGLFQVQRVILAYLNPATVDGLVERRFVYRSQ